MSLTPQFFDELRSRISISSVVGRKVTWEKGKTNVSRGDYWAPCPFHNEKTASFHCTESTGRYYCFGCHAKGDAINFVQQLENVSFIEAVEILASEAGLDMPKRDPKAQEKADKFTQMTDLMEQAVQFYRLQLRAQAARPAMEYLNRRGFGPDVQDRFDIGFAPNGRDATFQHFKDKGVSEAMLIEVGLVARPDDGRSPYDRFRDRIMFPIRDGRGRAIGFGGRAMDPNAKAKYYNSTQTPIFDKGRNLYNMQKARAATGKGQPLIVAEGYADVIALSEAGFEACVAPLGTAVTEDQLDLLWRMTPEPIIALDGDTAGLRAAYRVIDLALPKLGAGRALRFALMPQGLDPDDVIRKQGRDAMAAILERSSSLVDLLWQRETEGKSFDSPERKAAVHKALADAISKIPDLDLKKYYQEDLRQKEWQLFRARPAGGAQKRLWRPRKGQVEPALMQTRNSMLSQGDMDQANTMRERVVIAMLLSVPELRRGAQEALDNIGFRDQTCARWADAILRADDPITSDQLIAQIKEQFDAGAIDLLFADPHIRLCAAVRQPEDKIRARTALDEELAKLAADRGLELELKDAVEDFSHGDDDGHDATLWRLGQAALAKQRAVRNAQVDRSEYDIADNGAKVDRKQRETLKDMVAKYTQGKTS